MKRFYSDDVIEIKEIYPLLFWKRCECCDKEFRREIGFEVTEKYTCGDGRVSYNWWYYCNECVENKEKVVDLLKEPKYKIESKRKIKLYY